MRGKGETKAASKITLPVETSASIVYHPSRRQIINIITMVPNWQWPTPMALSISMPEVETDSKRLHNSKGNH